MRMTWSELLFAHWPIDPEIIAERLPAGLSVDTRDGKAWLGIVPFLMSDTSPRGFPAIPFVHRFLELNVRTYVTCEGKPGVWFFSLDAESRLAVRAARASFHLPYMDASMSMTKDATGMIAYRSRRTHTNEPSASFSASYRALSEPARAQPSTLEHWLTARYCLYAADRAGRLYRGEIDHPPWMLSRSEWNVETNSMAGPLGVQLTDSPHLLCAQPVQVRAWLLRRCDAAN